MGQRQAVLEIVVNASKAVNSLNQMNGSMTSLMNVVKLTSAAFAGMMVFDFIGEAEKLAAEVKNVRAAFDNMAPPGLLTDLRVATKGMVSDLDLMKQAVKFKNFALPMEQLATMLEFANMRAMQAGESVDYMVESIIVGLGRQSIKVLDNLQINIAAFKDLLAEGLTYADALATLMKEDMAGAAETNASAFTQFQVSLSNFAAGLSTVISQSQVLSGVFRLLTKIMDLASKGMRDLHDVAGEELASATYASVMKTWNGEVETAQKYYDRLKDAVDRSVEHVKKLQREQKNLTLGQMNDQWDTYTDNIKVGIAYTKHLSQAADNLAKSVNAEVAAQAQLADNTKKTTEAMRDQIKVTELRTPSLDVSSMLVGPNDYIEGLPDQPTLPMWDTDKMEMIQASMGILADTTLEFGNAMAQAILYGQSFGKAMVQALKAMVAQLMAAVAQALILAAIITMFPAVGAAMGVAGTFSQVLGTVLRGSDLYVGGVREGVRYNRTGK